MAVVAAVPKIIRALSADAHLDVSLLRRETARSCGGLNGTKLPPLCEHFGEKVGTGCVFVGPRTRNQTNATWSGLRPDTPPTSHAARLKSVSVRRFMTRQTENRGAPRLRRGFRFCD